MKPSFAVAKQKQRERVRRRERERLNLTLLALSSIWGRGGWNSRRGRGREEDRRRGWVASFLQVLSFRCVLSVKCFLLFLSSVSRVHFLCLKHQQADFTDSVSSSWTQSQIQPDPHPCRNWPQTGSSFLRGYWATETCINTIQRHDLVQELRWVSILPPKLRLDEKLRLWDKPLMMMILWSEYCSAPQPPPPQLWQNNPPPHNLLSAPRRNPQPHNQLAIQPAADRAGNL